MSDSLTLVAPAKVNLSLRVVGRREDGYHEIETLMVPIELADRLTLERMDGPAGALCFSCSDPEVPSDDGNLVVRALRALADAHGPLPALKAKLEKSIPHGAGLGGGSSDAAAALRGANELFGLGLPVSVLEAIAAGIGSDVPFFVTDGACLCRGRGELIEPRPDLRPRLPILLFKPAFPVPTPWAYGQWATAPALPGVSYEPQRVSGGDGKDVILFNDLERPVFAKHLVLADMKQWLRARPEVAAALMSGSGSTMIAVLRSPEPAMQLRAAASEEFGASLWMWQGWTR
jgi:4-diphosphocytidyl-2-C-methyl-D-erythritol kinase